MKKRGFFTFTDPLPPASYLTNVNLTLYGRFNCQTGTTGAAFVATLGQVFINFGCFNATPGGCTCSNCGVTQQLISPTQPLGWQGYNYSGYNTLDIFIIQGQICVSQILIEFVGKTARIVLGASPNITPAGRYSPQFSGSQGP